MKTKIENQRLVANMVYALSFTAVAVTSWLNVHLDLTIGKATLFTVIFFGGLSIVTYALGWIVLLDGLPKKEIIQRVLSAIR